MSQARSAQSSAAVIRHSHPSQAQTPPLDARRTRTDIAHITSSESKRLAQEIIQDRNTIERIARVFAH